MRWKCVIVVREWAIILIKLTETPRDDEKESFDVSHSNAQYSFELCRKQRFLVKLHDKCSIILSVNKFLIIFLTLSELRVSGKLWRFWDSIRRMHSMHRDWLKFYIHCKRFVCFLINLENSEKWINWQLFHSIMAIEQVNTTISQVKTEVCYHVEVNTACLDDEKVEILQWILKPPQQQHGLARTSIWESMGDSSSSAFIIEIGPRLIIFFNFSKFGNANGHLRIDYTQSYLIFFLAQSTNSTDSTFPRLIPQIAWAFVKTPDYPMWRVWRNRSDITFRRQQCWHKRKS